MFVAMKAYCSRNMNLMTKYVLELNLHMLMLILYDFVGSKEQIVLSAANHVFAAELLSATN